MCVRVSMCMCVCVIDGYTAYLSELSEADLAELDAFIEKTDTTTTPPSSSSVPPVSSISSTLEQGEDGGGSTLEQGEDGGGSSLPASPQNASQQNDIVLYKVSAGLSI